MLVLLLLSRIPRRALLGHPLVVPVVTVTSIVVIIVRDKDGPPRSARGPVRCRSVRDPAAKHRERATGTFQRFERELVGHLSGNGAGAAFGVWIPGPMGCHDGHKSHGGIGVGWVW